MSRLYPAGFSVVEVNKLPAGFNIYMTGNIRTAPFWLLPLTIRLAPKPPDGNYWMAAANSAIAVTGETELALRNQ